MSHKKNTYPPSGTPERAHRNFKLLATVDTALRRMSTECNTSDTKVIEALVLKQAPMKWEARRLSSRTRGKLRKVARELGVSMNEALEHVVRKALA